MRRRALTLASVGETILRAFSGLHSGKSGIHTHLRKLSDVVRRPIEGERSTNRPRQADDTKQENSISRVRPEMAHSPLFRTIMRGCLDDRAASLTRYEIAMEGICTDELGLRHAVIFNEEAWHNYRKRHELKAPREEKAEIRRKEFWRHVQRDDKMVSEPNARVLRYNTFQYPSKGRKLRRRAIEALPVVRSRHYLGIIDMARQLPKEGNTVTCTSYCDWRPPVRAEILRSEAFNENPLPRRRGTPDRIPYGGSYGEEGIDDDDVESEEEDENDRRARRNQAGLLHPRSLRDKLTPDYVPKPHLRRARARLLARSAEFARGVRGRVKEGKYKLPIAGGGFSDDSQDNSEHSSDEERRGGRKRRGVKSAPDKTPASKKRKTNTPAGAVAAAIASVVAKTPGAKTGTGGGAGGPKPFVKPFDSRAHDWRQLRSQARHRLALGQQKLPRVEQPLWGSRRSAAAETGEDEQNYAAAAAAAGVTSKKTDEDEDESSDSDSEEDPAAKAKRKKAKAKAKALAKEKEKKKEAEAAKANTGLTPAEEKALEEALAMLRAIGMQLPTRVPKNQGNGGGAKGEANSGTKSRGKAKPDPPAPRPDEGNDEEPFGEIGLEEAQKYRTWRRTSAKAVFQARNRYVRCRMYAERAQDQEVTLTVREILKFWKNRV